MDPLFRDGLLAGRTVVLAGRAPAIGERLTALGASVLRLEAGDDEGALQAAAGELGPVDALVLEARDEGPELARTWNVVRALATAAMIPESSRGGSIVLLAPAPGAVAHAEAVRAGVENLARTLSIEWARFGVRLTAVAPGADTDREAIASLAAYLVSPAGEYFSGARLDLGEAVQPAPASRSTSAREEAGPGQ